MNYRVLFFMVCSAFLYNNIYRNSSFGSYHPLSINRVSIVYDLTLSLGFDRHIEYMENSFANEKELSVFHSIDYIKALKKAEKLQYVSKEDQKKFNIGTYDNPVFPEMYRRHSSATGAGIKAAKLISKNYNYIFSPGSGAHHGRTNKASGFCYFNDIVTCILKLRDLNYRKILYFDMDAHYGDGVVEEFKDNGDIATFSIHQENLWPKTGNYLEDNINNTYNYPVKKNFSDLDFKTLVENHIINKIIKFKPEVAVLLMGTDSLKDDPMSNMKLTNNAMSWVINIFKNNVEKIILTGGGGYNPWILARAWTNNLAELLSIKIGPDINNDAKNILKNIIWKKQFDKRKLAVWTNTIKDEKNIFK